MSRGLKHFGPFFIAPVACPSRQLPMSRGLKLQVPNAKAARGRIRQGNSR